MFNKDPVFWKMVENKHESCNSSRALAFPLHLWPCHQLADAWKRIFRTRWTSPPKRIPQLETCFFWVGGGVCFRTDRRTFQLFGGPLTRDAPNSHATTTDRGPINHLICTLARGQEWSWETGKGDWNSWHVVCVPSGAKSRRTLSNCLTFRWSSWTQQPTTHFKWGSNCS